MDDLISRKAAIYAAREELESGTYFDIPSKIEALPAVQPNRVIIDNCLYHIATGGAISIKHYMQALYEEIYGEGGETVVDDLISRRAAIDAVSEACEECRGTFARCEEKLNWIPAIYPDHTADSDKKVSISCAHENDLISREAAIEALARMMPRSYTPDGSHPADEEIFRAQEVFADCIEALEILPSAQPEIIRCKDCKYWRDDHTCHEHSLVSPMCANEYCSRAERRTDETD